MKWVQGYYLWKTELYFPVVYPTAIPADLHIQGKKRLLSVLTDRE